MKILIIDRDDNAANLVRARLEHLGEQPNVMAVKNDAIESLDTTPVDVIYLDPAPLSNARQLVISIRRKLPTYTHIILMGEGVTLKDAMAAGANDALAKPFDSALVERSLSNARRMLDVQRRLNDPSEDFPSGGGVIAKSAFYQLFLSAIDRADRYAEQSYVMFITLLNVNQIKVMDNEIAANTTGAMLAHQLARIRRQSDILAQTGQYQYALLLQRPVYDTEPGEAALRFADTLSFNKELRGATSAPIDLQVRLLEVPSGAMVSDHEISVRDRAA